MSADSQKNISRQLSLSLQIGNLLAMLLVIAIHYNSIGNGSHDLFQEFFTNGIARVAVPFFSLISGFFLFRSYTSFRSYPIVLKKRISTLLIPYLLSSSLIFLSSVITGKEYKFSAMNIFRDIVLHPVAGQFWFLRDLILLVVLCPIIYLLVKRNIFFLVLCFLAWFANVQLFPKLAGWYLLNIETVFFMCLGCYLSLHPMVLEKIVNLSVDKSLLIIVGWLIFSLMRVYADPSFNICHHDDFSIMSLVLYKMSIIIGLVSIIRIASFPILHNNYLVTISSFTFFVYLFHTEPIRDIIFLFVRLFVSRSSSFYFAYPVAVVVSFGFAYFCEKKIPFVYNVLSGNRNTKKVLSRR